MRLRGDYEVVPADEDDLHNSHSSSVLAMNIQH